MNVYFLGPLGTFSHLMAKNTYSLNENKLIPLGLFDEIFLSVLNSTENIGIIPIENSITSNVHKNLDYLFKPEFQIIKESYLPIKLNLFCLNDTNLEDIKEVYSHHKALEQCSDFIRENNLKGVSVSSTAEAIKIIETRKDKSIAAIGNDSNLNHNIKIEKENIANQKVNFTRFLHITKNDGKDFSKISGLKISLVFKLPHIKGALSKLLLALEKFNINLTKIESRPIPGSNFEYNFWIDLELPDEDTFKNLGKVLADNTNENRVIGKYEIAPVG